MSELIPTGSMPEAQRAQMRGIYTDGSGNQYSQDISIDANGNVGVVRPDSRATGTIAAQTLNAVYSVALNGAGVVGFSVTNLTGKGAVLTLEGSYDGGATYQTAMGVSGGSGALNSTFTADGVFSVNAGGRTNLRLRVSTAGSAGNIAVASNVAAASSDVRLSTPLPAGSNLIGSVTAPQKIQKFDNSGPSNQPLYFGEAAPGSLVTDAAWTIKKVIYDSNNNPTDVQFASVTSGVPASNLVWNSRATYTFS